MAEAARKQPVRVSIPASIAADIGKYKEAIGSVLEHLGCPACCSGHDIFFELQRDLVLAKGVEDQPRVAATPRFKASGLDVKNTLRVAIDRIAEISGHPACATGCDMFLQIESNFVLNARGRIKEQAISIGNRVGI